jgi:hypothetical protein
MNQFSPSPRVPHKDRFIFVRKFAEIFASQGALLVSTTPVAYNGNNIGLLRPESELEGKNVSIR